MLESILTYGISPNTIILNDLSKHREFIKVSRIVLDSIRMRRGTESYEKKEGATEFGSFRDIRIVQLFGTIAAENNETLNQNEALLRKMFNPRYNEYLSNDGLGYLPLKWDEIHPSGVTRSLQMNLKAYSPIVISEDETEKLRRKFELTLAAIDPKKYDQTLTTVTDAVNDDVIVNGDDFTYPIITLMAADFTSVARITNAATGKYVELTGSFTGTLTIDMEAGTIVAGSTNKISMFTAGSEFFELAPGNNTLELTNISKVTLKFYKGYN